MQQQSAKPKRNGKIELFRFLFAFPVIFLHIHSHLVGLPKFNGWQFFFLSPHGAISVEFFFLVSGFLMAKSAYKAVQNNGLRIDTNRLVLDSFGFMRKKLRTIFPYHLVAYAFVFVAYVLNKEFGLLRAFVELLKSIPNLFLFYMLGMKSATPNPPEWYISAMLIAMVFLYPLLRKHYYKVTRVIGPIIALVLLTYMFVKTKSLSGVKNQLLFAYKAVYRAFAELLLGASGFEAARLLQQKKLPQGVKVLFTVYEFAAYLAVLAFSFTNAPKQYEYAALALLVVAIPITFSNQTCLNDLFNNKVCYFLGKISFFMYLCHMCPVFIAKTYMVDWQLRYKLIFIFAATFALSFVVEFGGNKLLALADKRKQKSA